jgi:hypothetical protein
MVAALLADGSIISGAGYAMASGPYERIAWCGVASTSVVALRVDGNVDLVTTAGVQDTALGCYRDVWGGIGGPSSTYAAIWSEDCDRDGELDAAQIRRGEIPDINGDLIDDRRQTTTVLPDTNGDGIADAAQSSALTWRHEPNTTSWHWVQAPSPRRELWMASQHVRRGAEVVDRVSWVTLREGTTYTFQPMDATVHIWADPNGDGDPLDCVELMAFPTTVRPGMNIIHFPPLRIGEHGDSVFVGMSWIRTNAGFGGPGMNSWLSSTTASADRLATSRLQGRMWVGLSADLALSPTAIARRQFGSDEPSASPLRGFESMEGWGIYGVVPCAALSPSWAIPADCDRDGFLDELMLANTYWRPRTDLDGNGRVDACEGDCDGDGVEDLDAVLAGATDCDRDLRPDDCTQGKDGPADCDADGVPDTCEGDDCDGNGVPDMCDLEAGALDVDGDGVLDACQRDCDRDGIPDHVQLAAGAPDCNGNGWIDACESADCDGDGTVDLCEITVAGDCNGNDIPDDCDISSGVPAWADRDGDGRIDACEFADGTETDCDSNGIPDSSEPDVDRDSIPDSCERARGDLTLDGVVNGSDLGLLLGFWGEKNPPLGDLDGNGLVDGLDLGIMLGNWGLVQW